ncbi:MAG: neutral/alkaline non-lysosomal ceramidase N-terminal domain-containing protein [Verrucomicrobia bacterium]|nr:neutral/alkaline non-lysosomal ceramidase N-terminal domain-containing protein [Verrucomicrobiota bacterium]
MRERDSHLLFAGAAVRAITPSERVPFGEVKWCGNSRGVHDDIFVRALFLSARRDFLLVVSDVMLIFSGLAAELRKRISQATRLPEDAIMIAATQNHSAPAMYGGDGWERPDYDGYWKTWWQQHQEQVIQVSREACANAREARLRMSRGCAKGIAGNRRPIGKDGKVIMTWHKPREEDIRDWGDEDPSVTVFRFDEKNGKPIAVVFHFSCHPNCAWATRKISSDFYGIACRRIQEAHPDAMPMFLNGACGDIDPTKYMTTPKECYNAPMVFEEGRQVDLAFADIRRLGYVLGEEVIRIAETGKAVSVERIIVKSRHCEVELREGASMSVNTSLELQGIALGGQVAWLGIPGEPFLKIQTKIRTGSAFPDAFVIGHANGYSGYFPAADDYAKGGYGVGIGESPLDKNSGELIVSEAIGFLGELHAAATRSVPSGGNGGCGHP